MGLEIIKGKNFPDNLNKEIESFVIIDERTLNTLNLGTPSDAIGQNIVVEDSTLVEVIGVIKNYHYAALFLPIRPLILRYTPDDFRVLALRVESGINPSIIAKIENEWEKIDKYNEFEGEFLDAEIKDYYSYFEDILYTVGFASVLAIVIACLGLLGMATYSTQTRIKEIGVRKVLGASIGKILVVFNKEFMKWILLSNLIGWPIAYYVSQKILENSVYRIEITLSIFLLTALITFAIAILAVCYQSIKIAISNPVEALRYE